MPQKYLLADPAKTPLYSPQTGGTPDSRIYTCLCFTQNSC